MAAQKRTLADFSGDRPRRVVRASGRPHENPGGSASAARPAGGTTRLGLNQETVSWFHGSGHAACRSSGANHGFVSAVFRLEFPIAHGEVDDSLDESDQRGNDGPEKYQIENSLADTAQIEFVNSKTAQQQREDRR